LQEELIQKTLKLESDNQELLGRVQSVLDEKSTDTESLQHEITKRDLQAETFEKQISELRSFLDEKEQLYISSTEREKSLEEQKLQVCVYNSCKYHDVVICRQHITFTSCPGPSITCCNRMSTYRGQKTV
jgi:predicted nuclease with TOPRIM domain